MANYTFKLKMLLSASEPVQPLGLEFSQYIKRDTGEMLQKIKKLKNQSIRQRKPCNYYTTIYI